MQEKQWIKIRCDITPFDRSLQETIRSIFTEYCGGIEENADNKNKEIIFGYLEATKSGQSHLNNLRSVLRLAAQKTGVEFIGKVFSTEMIGDVDWATSWKKYFRPERIGEHYIVYPSWDPPQAHTREDRLILLDPGQAFGTGQHETTQLCIRLMETLDTTGWRVADVGCGTGILSIASLLAGAKNVIGMDTDPVAIQVARENAKQNHVESAAVFRPGTAADLRDEEPFQLVFANILAHILREIGSDLAAITGKRGYMIWSGILLKQENQIRETLSGMPVKIMRTLSRGEWIAFLIRRN